MEFDFETDRCYDCDGKFRHFAGCPWYTGEPILSVRERVEARHITGQ